MNYLNYLITYAEIAQQETRINKAFRKLNKALRQIDETFPPIDTNNVRDFVYNHLLDLLAMYDVYIIRNFAALKNDKQFTKLRQYLEQYTDDQLATISAEEHEQIIQNAIRIAKQAD